MKKRLIPLLLALVLLLAVPAQAVSSRSLGVNPTLSFEGTTANCSVLISRAGSEINATLTLWKGNRVIDSWSGTGTSMLYISGSCTVRTGEEYVLRLTGTIDGEPMEVIAVRGTC